VAKIKPERNRLLTQIRTLGLSRRWRKKLRARRRVKQLGKRLVSTRIYPLSLGPGEDPEEDPEQDLQWKPLE
jgi:hypothetical protein